MNSAPGRLYIEIGLYRLTGNNLIMIVVVFKKKNTFANRFEKVVFNLNNCIYANDSTIS